MAYGFCSIMPRAFVPKTLYIFIAAESDIPYFCKNRSRSCMERVSLYDFDIFLALSRLMPFKPASFSGCFEITSSVSAPKASTSFFAVASRTPSTAPDAR